MIPIDQVQNQKPLSADEIVAMDDRPVFEVFIPQWNRTCQVRELDVLTLREISESARKADGKIDEADYSAKVIVEGSVDPKFRIDHIEALKRKSHRAVTQLFNAIMDGKKN